MINTINERSKICGKCLLYFSVFVAILSTAIHLTWSEIINPAYIQITPENPIPVSASRHNLLSNFKKISIEDYHGPESLVIYENAIYTGVVEGKIIKINESGIHVFASFSPPGCGTPDECGRPLGLRLSKDSKQLIVVDAYLGVYTVSITDGTHRKIFPANRETKYQPVFFNDFDFLPNNSIVLSDSSATYPVDVCYLDVLEGRPNGRLIIFDPETGAAFKSLDGFYFPNGIQMHRDGNSVLVAETTTFRILRVPLDEGKISVFADGLPGRPDNIRASPRGGYLVPVSGLRRTLMGKFLDWIAKYPTARLVMANLLRLPFLKSLVITKSAMILRLDENGEIVEIWEDPQSTIPNIAEVAEHQGQLYTSSYYLPYIGQLKV